MPGISRLDDKGYLMSWRWIPVNGLSPGMGWYYTADLAISILLAMVGILCVALDLPLTVRIAVSIPVLVFIPGYLFTVALYPEDTDLSAVERAGFSLSSSAAMVGLVLGVLSLGLLPFRFSSISVAVGVALLSLFMVAVSFSRRRGLVSRGCTVFTPLSWRREGSDRVSGRAWSPARYFFVGMVVLSIGAVGMGAFVSPPAERFTELIAHNGTTSPGGASPAVVVEIRNHEGGPVTYTVESYLGNRSFDPASNRSTISERRSLGSSVITVDDASSSNLTLSLPRSGAAGGWLDILLFKGNAPAAGQTSGERFNASYRNLSIMVGEGAPGTA